MQSAENCDVRSPASAWHNLSQESYFHLRRLAVASLTCFHTNSDAECEIGKNHDIDDFEKRNCLSGK